MNAYLWVLRSGAHWCDLPERYGRWKSAHRRDEAQAVIPSNRSRKVIIRHDTLVYKNRDRIERCFGRLKHFRRFATRYDRKAIHFTGFIHLAAAMIWLR